MTSSGKLRFHMFGEKLLSLLNGFLKTVDFAPMDFDTEDELQNGVRGDKPDTSGIGLFFNAESIAIIGASNDGTKISGQPFRYLKTLGYAGRVYAVNPTRAEVQGEKSYSSLADIPEPVELALIATPATRAEEAVREAAAHGVRVAVVFAGGFAETGDDGRQTEARICKLARDSGMRLLGPNCLGVMNFPTRQFLTFSQVPDESPLDGGCIAVISQSGAVGNYLLTRAMDTGLPIARWIATGNECEVTFADVLAHAVQDPEIRAVAGYFEGAKNGPALIEAFDLARRLRKPVVLLKVGTTELGAQAVSSHTDAIVGDDQVFDALFRQKGVCRASSIQEMLDMAAALHIGAIPRGDKLLITTISGGVGIITAEEAERRGARLPHLSEAAKIKLKERLPFISAQNPLDVTGQAVQDFSLIEDALRIGIEDTGADIIINFIGLLGRQHDAIEHYKAVLGSISAQYPDTVIITVAIFAPETTRELMKQGYIVYDDPTRAAIVAARLAGIANAYREPPHEDDLDLSSHALPRPNARPNERDGYEMLSRAGIAVPPSHIVNSADGAAAAFSDLGGPVVMKILSADIIHKTDIGGVRLNVSSADEAHSAYEDICRSVAEKTSAAPVGSILVMRQAAGFAETFIGTKLDPQLGPVVSVGLGGVLIEVLKDVAVRPAPVSIDEAGEMIDELRGRALLDGFRGEAPRDIDALADAVHRLSLVAAANADWLQSLEVNPFALTADGETSMALDCVVTLREQN